MNITVEKIYPAILALIAAACWYRFSPEFPRDEKEFLGAAISVGSIFTGFIATAKAILASLPSNALIKKLRQAGYMEIIISYMTAGLYGCLVFSVYSVAGFFFLKDPSPSLEVWYSTGWMGLAVYALLAFHRVASFLSKILRVNPD